jgi:hypothetical protein
MPTSLAKAVFWQKASQTKSSKMMPFAESTWVKTSGCKLGGLLGHLTNKDGFPSWFSANSLIRWRFMKFPSKNTAQTISGACCAPQA